LANRLGSGTIATVANALAKRLVGGAHRDQRLTRDVVDHLSIHMLQRSIDAEAGTLWGTANALADAIATAKLLTKFSLLMIHVCLPNPTALQLRNPHDRKGSDAKNDHDLQIDQFSSAPHCFAFTRRGNYLLSALPALRRTCSPS